MNSTAPLQSKKPCIKTEPLLFIAGGVSASLPHYEKIKIPKWGMNYAYKICPKLDYYTNFHARIPEPNRDFILQHPEIISFVQYPNNIGVPVWASQGMDFKKDMFSSGVSSFKGSTIWAILQIVYSVGFRKVYVIGLDACSVENKNHAYEYKNAQTIETIYDEIILVSRIFKDAMPSDFQIFNCSPYSRIDVFPFADLPY